MDIKREFCASKVSIQLTENELRQAYEEQQHIYDIEDIKYELEDNIETYDVSFHISILPVSEDELDSMALELRRRLDFNSGEYWAFAKKDAIFKVLHLRDI